MKVDIPFDNNWKRVAIAVSGGADSALLAFLVCQTVTERNINPFTVHVINNIRCWKTKPWQQSDFKKVYNWLVQRFPKINFQIHTNFVPPELEWANKGPSIIDEYGKLVSGDTLELRSFAEFVCINQDVDAYFNGVTRNPKGVDFQGMHTRDIEPTEENRHLKLMIHMGKLVSHPFRFLDKSWIIKKYYELELEDLLNTTRSCEGTVPGLDYTNYKPYQYVPVCGECFWCKEREWGIKCQD